MRAIDRAVYNWYGYNEERRAFARRIYRHDRHGFWKCLKRAYYRTKKELESEEMVSIPYKPAPRPAPMDPWDYGPNWWNNPDI